VGLIFALDQWVAPKESWKGGGRGGISASRSARSVGPVSIATTVQTNSFDLYSLDLIVIYAYN